MTGPGDSPVHVDCRVVAGSPPVARELPIIVDRMGIDLSPPDLTDPDDARWLLACVARNWPVPAGRPERSRWVGPILQLCFKVMRSRLFQGDWRVSAKRKSWFSIRGRSGSSPWSSARRLNLYQRRTGLPGGLVGHGCSRGRGTGRRSVPSPGDAESDVLSSVWFDGATASDAQVLAFRPKPRPVDGVEPAP